MTSQKLKKHGGAIQVPIQALNKHLCHHLKAKQMFLILKSSSPLLSHSMSDIQQGPQVSPVRSELYVTHESLHLT